MKNFITLRNMIKRMAFRTMFFVGCLHAQQVTIQNAAVTPEQKQSFEAMVNILKNKTKHHLDLCIVGASPRYMNMTQKEFEYRFDKSAKDLEDVVNRIVSFYKTIGVNSETIRNEEEIMRANIYNCKNLKK